MENQHFQQRFEELSHLPVIRIETKEAYQIRAGRMGSLLLLFMEHCRLCALWASKINYLGVPHKNLLHLLNEQWDYYGDSEFYVDQIRDKFNTASSIGLYLYLSWHLHKTEIDAMGYKELPDPYEPLLRFILRGGEIRYEPGSLIIVTGLYMKIPERNHLLPRTIPFIDANSIEALNDADKKFLVDPQKFLNDYIAKYTFCRRSWNEFKKS